MNLSYDCRDIKSFVATMFCRNKKRKGTRKREGGDIKIGKWRFFLERGGHSFFEKEEHEGRLEIEMGKKILNRGNQLWTCNVGTLIVGSPEHQIVGSLIVRFSEHQHRNVNLQKGHSEGAGLVASPMIKSAKSEEREKRIGEFRIAYLP